MKLITLSGLLPSHLFIILNVGSGGTRFGIDMHSRTGDIIYLYGSLQLQYGASTFM